MHTYKDVMLEGVLRLFLIKEIYMEVKGIRKEAFVCDKYVAGKSTDEVMEDYGLTSVVKLGSNENMYAPYQIAIDAMKSELDRINIYPEKNYVRLKELIAEDYGVTSDWVSLGHGAGNVLDEVAKTLLEDGDEIVTGQQSYLLYQQISKIMGGQVVTVPLNENFTIETKEIISKFNEHTKIVWLCNPNNPTGSVIDKATFQELVDALPERAWLVVDEAYADFADQDALPNTIDYIKEGKQVILIRTFSKYQGIAGARIGCLIANPDFVNWYDTVSEPFNANRMGLAAAVALMSPEGKKECRKYGDLMVADRKWLNEELTKLGCDCFDSQANFVFFSTPYDASEVAELLLRKGVIVRPCGGWGYTKHIRVSVGTHEQNEIFLEKFKETLEELSK